MLVQELASIGNLVLGELNILLFQTSVFLHQSSHWDRVTHKHSRSGPLSIPQEQFAPMINYVINYEGIHVTWSQTWRVLYTCWY